MKPVFILTAFFSFFIALFCLAVEPAPVLRGDYGKDVLPRYHFNAGDEFITNLISSTKTEIFTKTQTITIAHKTTISARLSVKSVDKKGLVSLQLLIARIVMKTDGKQTMVLDTDKPGEALRRKDNYLSTMINVPVFIKIKPTGEIVDTDLKNLAKAFRNAGQGALLSNANDLLDKLFQNTFIHLPEKPVKTGDIYDAGEFLQPMPGSSEIVNHVQFRISGISADKKSVLMNQEGSVIIHNQKKGAVQIKLNSSRLKGWILFDLEKGNLSKSDTSLEINIVLSQGKMKIKNRISTDNKCTIMPVFKIKP